MCKLAVIDMPYLGAESGDEFGRMRDDADCSAPFFDRDSETAERFSIQEVRGLVQE